MLMISSCATKSSKLCCSGEKETNWSVRDIHEQIITWPTFNIGIAIHQHSPLWSILFDPRQLQLLFLFVLCRRFLINIHTCRGWFCHISGISSMISLPKLPLCFELSLSEGDASWPRLEKGRRDGAWDTCTHCYCVTDFISSFKKTSKSSAFCAFLSLSLW